MSNEWDDVADEWDEAASVRAYAAAAHASLLEIAEAADITLDGVRACDFGCGTGRLTERLALHCASVDAVDTSTAMLARLRAKVRDHGWTHVDVLPALPDRESTYDLVVASSALAFVDDHPATVAALAARLGEGGLFVQWDWEAEPDDPDHAGLTRQAIQEALVAAGLTGGAVIPAFTIEADGERMRPLVAWGIRRSAVDGPAG